MHRKEIKEIVETWRNCSENYSATARQLGIDRRTVKQWIVRCRQPYGYVRWNGVERGSTVPKHQKKALNLAEKNRITTLRKQTGFCSEKLAIIAREDGILVSESTIHRLLAYNKLLRASKKRRRPLFQNGRAMRPSNTPALGYLQMDVKHVTPELSGLPYTCYEYAAIDILSRYKVALLQPVLDEAGSIILLRYALQTCPFPVRYVQTDNGLEFQRRFHDFCEQLTVEHYYIHKNTPIENAVIERSFRTDEEEFYFWLENIPKDINELNLWFQKYLLTYNTVRPHLGIKMLRPKEFVDLYIKS
jgi:transposase InsO family protein